MCEYQLYRLEEGRLVPVDVRTCSIVRKASTAILRPLRDFVPTLRRASRNAVDNCVPIFSSAMHLAGRSLAKAELERKDDGKGGKEHHVIRQR